MTTQISYQHIPASQDLNSAILTKLRSLNHRLSNPKYFGTHTLVRVRPLAYRPTGFLNVVEVELGVNIPKLLNFVVKRHGSNALTAAQETISAAEKVIRRWTEKREGARRAKRRAKRRLQRL